MAERASFLRMTVKQFRMYWVALRSNVREYFDDRRHLGGCTANGGCLAEVHLVGGSSVLGAVRAGRNTVGGVMNG